MSLPTSRDTTYVSQQGPAIGAGDLNDMQDFIVAACAQYFGNGVDGTYTLDGVQGAVAGLFTLTGNTYTLQRDAYFYDLTLADSGNILNPIWLNTNGYRLFIKGTLTVNNNALLGNPGGAGGTGGGGLQAAAGTVGGGGAGGGTSGAPGTGLGSGAMGGNGGNGGSGSAGGVATQFVAGPLGTIYSGVTSAAMLGFAIGISAAVPAFTKLNGGAGGGAGTLVSGSFGGGGGGGGVAVVCARVLNLYDSSRITCVGGKGGDRLSTSTGGGGGGGGGLFLAYMKKKLIGGGVPSFSAAISCPGGQGGAGGGVVGSNGQLVEINFGA